MTDNRFVSAVAVTVVGGILVVLFEQAVFTRQTTPSQPPAAIQPASVPSEVTTSASVLRPASRRITTPSATVKSQRSEVLSPPSPVNVSASSRSSSRDIASSHLRMAARQVSNAVEPLPPQQFPVDLRFRYFDGGGTAWACRVDLWDSQTKGAVGFAVSWADSQQYLLYDSGTLRGVGQPRASGWHDVELSMPDARTAALIVDGSEIYVGRVTSTLNPQRLSLYLWCDSRMPEHRIERVTLSSDASF
jgi:hypothetical protein